MCNPVLLCKTLHIVVQEYAHGTAGHQRDVFRAGQSINYRSSLLAVFSCFVLSRLAGIFITTNVVTQGNGERKQAVACGRRRVLPLGRALKPSDLFLFLWLLHVHAMVALVTCGRTGGIAAARSQVASSDTTRDLWSH